MNAFKQAMNAIVDAVTPKPTPAERKESLRTAKAELAEALKITPEALQNSRGLPDAHLTEAAIDCCEKAMRARDAELAFRQDDTESQDIFETLAETFEAKASEARKLTAAVEAAEAALATFRDGLQADVQKAEAERSALNARRRAEDLPGARALPHDRDRPAADLRSLLGDLELVKAAELLRRPVPGRDPSEGDLIQSRINEIRRLDTERETKRAVKAMPHWEDLDAWVAKWLSKDRAGREEMEARGRELQNKASGRWY